MLAFVGLPALGNGAAAAQARLVVPPRPECGACELRMSRVVTLGGLDEPVGITGTVLRDSRGRFFLRHDASGEQILVFGSDGALLRTLGGSGEGPGEFRFVMTLALGRGDTLHAFDAELARETVFSPSLDLVRTRRLPGRVRQVVLLDDDRAVVQAGIPTSERIGLPLHLLGRDRTVVRSFGAEAEDRTVRPDMPILGLRALAGARGGRVWSAFVNEYEIELWDTAGRKQLEVVRRPTWFEPWFHDRPFVTS